MDLLDTETRALTMRSLSAPAHKQFLVYFHLLEHEMKELIFFDFCNI